MNFCSGYSRLGINTVKNLSQKTPWPSKIMGGNTAKASLSDLWIFERF